MTFELVLATSLWTRLTGLLKKDRCREHEVLMLAPCRSIHSFGMRECLDIAFIDKEAGVLLAERSVPPAQMRRHPRAVAVLERRSDESSYWPVTGEKLQLCGNSLLKQEKEDEL